MNKNPFAEPVETQNQTQIQLVIRHRPDDARRLIEQAGKSPEDFGWNGENIVTDKGGFPR